MKLYTIGFTQKSAEEFFGRLLSHGVQRLVDIRVHPQGQLAGFARQEDLPYFLRQLADGCEYAYHPELAPTKEMMKDYRESGDWPGYAARFEALMDERRIPAAMQQGEFERQPCCLLCSEAGPEHCHRRLVAERLAAHWPQLSIEHL
jgi:uncharacterized protein (DUF488 family)